MLAFKFSVSCFLILHTEVLLSFGLEDEFVCSLTSPVEASYNLPCLEVEQMCSIIHMVRAHSFYIPLFLASIYTQENVIQIYCLEFLKGYSDICY